MPDTKPDESNLITITLSPEDFEKFWEALNTPPSEEQIEKIRDLINGKVHWEK